MGNAACRSRRTRLRGGPVVSVGIVALARGRSLRPRRAWRDRRPSRAASQNFGERIIDCPFLSKGNNSILGHGVTLLLGGSGGLITNPVTPPSSHRHPVHRIAPSPSPEDPSNEEMS